MRLHNNLWLLSNLCRSFSCVRLIARSGIALLLFALDDLHVLNDGKTLLGRLGRCWGNDHILVFQFLHEGAAVSVLGGLGWLLSHLGLEPLDPLRQLGVLAEHSSKLFTLLGELGPHLFHRGLMLSLHSVNFSCLLLDHFVFLELVLITVRLELFLLASKVHLNLFHPSLQLLLLFVNFVDELLVGNLHRLHLGLPVGEVLIVPQHHLPLLRDEGVDLLPRLLQLLISLFLFLRKGLFLVLKLLTLASVLGYFAFGNFTPFLQELYIVLLGFFLNHFVVLVHLAHQFDMALVHVFHVLLYFRDVRLCELDGHKISHAVL